MTDVVGAFEARLRPLAPSGQPAPRTRTLRLGWRAIAAVATCAVVAAVSGVLVADAADQHGRADRAQRALSSTNHLAARVATDLSALRRQLDLLTTQVGSDTTALDQDVAQLQGATSALRAAQLHVTVQGSQIGALHTCLSGVQQALNALSVGNLNDALWFLALVSSSCNAAAASGG